MQDGQDLQYMGAQYDTLAQRHGCIGAGSGPRTHTLAVLDILETAFHDRMNEESTRRANRPTVVKIETLQQTQRLPAHESMSGPTTSGSASGSHYLSNSIATPSSTGATVMTCGDRCEHTERSTDAVHEHVGFDEECITTSSVHSDIRAAKAPFQACRDGPTCYMPPK